MSKKKENKEKRNKDKEKQDQGNQTHVGQGSQVDSNGSPSAPTHFSSNSSSSISVQQIGSLPTVNNKGGLRSLFTFQSPFNRKTIAFEFFLFFYLSAHLWIQNFNIYHMSFYNYNYYLIFLSSILLCKRILLKYIHFLKQRTRENVNSLSRTSIIFNAIIICTILFNSVHLIIQLFIRYPFKNFLFLFYPYFGSILMFGFTEEKKGADPIDRLLYQLKVILYSSFECGYFAGFLPLKFIQHEYIYYDTLRCTLLMAFVFCNSFVMLSTRLLESSFTELFFHSHLLGTWTEVYQPEHIENIETWTRKRYLQGSVVKHKGRYYVAVAPQNISEPGHLLSSLLYLLFQNPERTHSLLISFQGLIVISQWALLLNSNHWNIYGVMLLFNYYIFYLCLCTRRDNLSLFKQYSSLVSSPSLSNTQLTEKSVSASSQLGQPQVVSPRLS